MRKTSGGAFYSETETATTSAPTLSTDGSACKMLTVGGDAYNADSWLITSDFSGGDSTAATVVVWAYVGGAWCNGSSYDLKATSDAAGGGMLSIPADGPETRLYLQVTALDGSSKSVALKAFHGEHSEAL